MLGADDEPATAIIHFNRRDIIRLGLIWSQNVCEAGKGGCRGGPGYHQYTDDLWIFALLRCAMGPVGRQSLKGKTMLQCNMTRYRSLDRTKVVTLLKQEAIKHVILLQCHKTTYFYDK